MSQSRVPVFLRGTRGVYYLYINRRIAAAHCTGNQMGGPWELSADNAELQLARWPEGPRFQAVGLDFGGLGCFSTEGM
jgi:hypothetical protein